MMIRRHFLLCGAALVALDTRSHAQPMPGMTGPPDTPAVTEPPARSGLILPEGEPLRLLPKLRNISGRSGAFTGSLVAAPTHLQLAPGNKTEVLAYNGISPGPLIEVTEGDHVTIEFENKVPGQESTIHWHGLPVPADQDGNPMNSVASGSHRTYSFTLPADSAGSFWYHPHPERHTPEQVFRGLAGAFIVKPKVDPLPVGLGDTALFISDLRLMPDGKIPPNTGDDWVNGREGDHVLINGQKRPVVTLAPGSSRRFRLFNACNARYLRLAFEGHRMALVATDGGLIPAPIAGLEDILLSPGERAEVVVDFRSAAGSVLLNALPYDRGRMSGQNETVAIPVLTINLAGQPTAPIALPARLRTISPLGAPTARKRLEFGERMTNGPNGMDFEGFINGKRFELGRIDLDSRLGEIELWEVANPTDMDHPLHLHGTQFQVVEREQSGRITPASDLAWKDTVNVVRGGIVRFLVRQDMPGLRVYHCHILEHEERGMMGTLKVR